MNALIFTAFNHTAQFKSKFCDNEKVHSTQMLRLTKNKHRLTLAHSHTELRFQAPLLCELL